MCLKRLSVVVYVDCPLDAGTGMARPSEWVCPLAHYA